MTTRQKVLRRSVGAFMVALPFVLMIGHQLYLHGWTWKITATFFVFGATGIIVLGVKLIVDTQE